MDDLDFSKPAHRPPPPKAPPALVDLALALEFFRGEGKAESVAAGETIFTQNEKAGLFKRDKMYLLLEGEVSLVAGGKPIGTVGSGEVFGEMAAISHSPRSATAIATTACRLIGLDDRGFRTALKSRPEFALSLLAMMTGRLRAMLERAQEANALAAAQIGKERRVFDKALLAALERGLGSMNIVRYKQGMTIMTEGSAGVMMYAVLEGRVEVSIRGQVVERVGTGGIFGEMALVDQSPRAASAVAETDCALLGMNRAVFLQLTKTNPEFGVALLTAISERVRYVAARLA
jgi:CRP-like cAMP-binding protein